MDALPYYRSALIGLRFVEARERSARRFGPEADARWQGFRGDLKTADRIELLIRDADAQWVGAFGARTVFRLESVCEDDAFGAAWEPLDPVDAEELWRAQVGAAPSAAPSAAQRATVPEALTAVAKAWGLGITPLAVGAIGPSDRLVVAGPSAVVSLAAAFAEGVDLDWAAQVTVVATAPGHRQLAALAAAMVNATRIGALFACLDRPDVVLGARLLVSPDAAAEDRALAARIAPAAGG